MILGGIPFYLSLLDPAKSMIENIDYLFFRRNNEMRTEFDELYNAIFNNAGKYLEVVVALYRNKDGLTSTEIRKTTGIEGKCRRQPYGILRDVTLSSLSLSSAKNREELCTGLLTSTPYSISSS